MTDSHTADPRAEWINGLTAAALTLRLSHPQLAYWVALARDAIERRSSSTPTEVSPSKTRVSDEYLQMTLSQLARENPLESQLISAAFYQMLCNEIVERRRADVPPIAQPSSNALVIRLRHSANTLVRDWDETIVLHTEAADEIERLAALTFPKVCCQDFDNCREQCVPLVDALRHRLSQPPRARPTYVIATVGVTEMEDSDRVAPFECVFRCRTYEEADAILGFVNGRVAIETKPCPLCKEGRKVDEYGYHEATHAWVKCTAVETPASLMGALHDKVHTDPGPVRAGKSVKANETGAPRDGT